MPANKPYDNTEEAQNKGPEQPRMIKYFETEQLEVNFLDNRIKELKQSRQDVEGVNIDNIWTEADRTYQPRLFRKENDKMLVQGQDWSDAETSQFVSLEDDDHWQSDNIQPTEYIKIQGVLSIIVDSIPEATFESFSERYYNAALIQKQLHKTSWRIMSSVRQLRYFTFNCSKYGFAIGHTFPIRKGWNVQLYNQETGKYYETFHVERDGVYRESLDPRYCWVDDMAIPADPLSARDWYREFKLPREEAEGRYGHLKNWASVPKGDISPQVNQEGGSDADKKLVETDTVTVGIYENKVRDQLAAKINDIWVIIRHPLPGKHKRLSCWYAPWSIRSANTIYGIGIPEAMRQDKNLKDKVRNMSIDALVAAIYPFGFYSGSNEVSGTGEIRYRPGKFNRVTSPKDIGFLKSPGPGQDVERFLESLDKDLDEESAYTRALAGEQIGKTAFEVKNSRDAGLQRLQLPLKEIAEALAQDGVLTAHLHEQILSIPEVIELIDPELIERYKKEVEVIRNDGTVGPDPELFQEIPSEESDTETKTFAYIFPEVQLGLTVLPDGTLKETDEEQFFRIKPSGIKWEGIVWVKPASIVSRNEQIEKQQTLELFDVVVPLLTEVPPELVPRIAPAVRQVFKAYGEDPFKWLPPEFFQLADQLPAAQAPQEEPLFVGGNGLPVANPVPPEEEGEQPVGSRPKSGGLPTVSGRGRERLAIRREQSKAQIENRVASR